MTKLRKILLVVCAVALVVSMASCKKPGGNDVPTEPSGDVTHTVRVTDESGVALEGVGVYVYEDEYQTELVWFNKTDAAGEMTFTAPAGQYYAVLSDVPGNYVAEDMYTITEEQTIIVVKTASLDEVDPENVRYKLGDTIGDFTVVDTNGDEHKLSQLLQSKKAVVLNFWYIECNPCRAEFPYMNEAYIQYASDIALIAMNPVNNSEEDIAAFKSEVGLDFPVVMADPAWAQMLNLTAYPTTVVIDRTGVISLFHVGSIDNADTFKQIFQYFTADDYVPGVVESLEDLPPLEEEEDTLGTAENPDQQGAAGTEITLKPGQEYYLQFYKASGMYMNVTGSNFYVIHDGQKTNSSAGFVGMMVETEGINYPFEVIVGNPTDKEQKISFAFGALKGSYGNPYKLALGEFDMKTTAGSEEGTFGTYTAEKDGTLTVRCLRSSVSKYGFYLYNLRSYAMRNTNDDGLTDEDGYITVSVKVKKGDSVQFSVAVARNDDNVIVAGSFQFELILEDGDGEEDKKAEPPKIGYSITVTDEEGNPMEGVAVNLKGEFTYEPTENDPEGLEPVDVKVDLNLTTDAEGHVISEQISGPYTAIIRVPEGYILEQTEYALTADEYTITIQLQKIVLVDYVITVTDEEGQPVAGVMLMVGANMGATNEQGQYTVSMEEEEYSVFLLSGIPEGYVMPTDSFMIAIGESELTIVLEKEGEPEPEYTDIFGEFPIVTEQLAPGQKAYYNIYNAGGADLVIEDADAIVIIDEVTYEAVDGVVTAPIPMTMGRMPAQVIIGNAGEETESYTAKVVFPVGTQQNPEELELGEFTAELAAGDTDGYLYIWTAEEDGLLTLSYTGEAVAGETFDVMLTNTTTYECPIMSESEDGKSVSVAVKAGEQVTVLVSSYPDAGWEYPAISLEMNAVFAEVSEPEQPEEPETPDEPEVPDEPETPSELNYTVTVTDFQNNPMAGVAVQILEDGKAVKVGVTDTSGKLTAEMKAGNYDVKLAFSTTGNHYEELTAVLSAEAPALTILVTSAVPAPGVEDHWMLGDAGAVELGGTYVSIQQNVMTYFLFTPTEEGTYSFTTSDPAAEISYWGGENFPSNQTANTDYKDNKFTLSVNASYLGQSYVIGITGADDCILIINREGAAAFDPNEVPYTEYELAEEPKSFAVTEEGTLTFVNLSGKAEDYTLVKGEDGFYHFGTADGPIAYICLGGSAPYLSLYTMCGGGGAMSGAPFRYTDYTDLDNIVKEDYTSAILAYGDCMDQKYGVYPVTEDLVYIMTMGVEYKGWAKSENPNFLFGDVENFNAELGWMFALCYFVK